MFFGRGDLIQYGLAAAGKGRLGLRKVEGKEEKDKGMVEVEVECTKEVGGVERRWLRLGGFVKKEGLEVRDCV